MMMRGAMENKREHELKMMLAELQRSYREASQPLIDELIEIDAKKPRRHKPETGTHYLPAHLRGMTLID